MMLYICTKFPMNISKGFRLIEQTRFVTDGQTENYGENNMSPSDGGDINICMHNLCTNVKFMAQTIST